MLKSRLGFGMMRLPVIGGDPTNFDYEKLNEMVDTFLAAGYTYDQPGLWIVFQALAFFSSS